MTDAPPNAGITITATLPSDLSRREARAILVAIIDQHGTSIIPPLSLSRGEIARISGMGEPVLKQPEDVFNAATLPKKQHPY